MKESEIQRDILEWLKKRELLCWRNQNMPTYGRNRFMPRGMPDIFCMIGGILLGIEVKTPTGRLSLMQIEFGDELVKAGGHYCVVTSLQECIDYISHNFAIQVFEYVQATKDKASGDTSI